jgi:glucose/arabinose dehydrogenase
LVAAFLTHSVAFDAFAQKAPDPVTPETVAKGLAFPWAVAFLPEGRFLVTERPGRLRVVQADGRVGEPVQGLPAVAAAGQGGLLDVVLDSDFARNRMLYLCFSEPGDEPSARGNSTALAAARLSDDGQRLERLRVIFSQRPKVASSLHFGCRIVEGMKDGKPDGSLYLGLGERFSQRDPFAGKAGALPEIHSWGHRNIQGATLDGQGRLWVVEHGPQGGDELNLVKPGANYGWPVVTYGENYGGGKIGEGTSKPGMAQPQAHWVPSFAPSGLAWLSGTRYGPAWQGSLFVGALKGRALLRLGMDGDAVREQQWLLQGLQQRIRDVRQGPDGLLYVLTDAADGQLIRLLPKP